MIRFFRYSLCIFFIVCGFLSAAQNYVAGIINNEYGKPVSFASIKFKKDSTGIAKSFCIADVNGKYLLPIGKAQKGWIVISAVGFVDFNSFFQFSVIDTLTLDLTISTSSKELPGITIKNKPSIEISGDTTSYNADRFKRGNESTVSELLNNIPGFTSGPGGSVIYNGKIIDRVLINGDDLTGTSYSKLITSLDVNGIEKLQVIQNYSSGDNLLNSLVAGKEQVLNLSYKKGFLQKFFGTADGGIGLPVKYYNAGIQTMGLFDKIKILAITKINSIGNTNSNPDNTRIPDDVRIDPESDVELIDRNPVASINDLSTGLDGVKSLYKNNSATTMLNFLIKPAKKLSIRGYFNFLHDKFGQQMDNTTTYFIEPAFTISKKNDILRRLQKANGLFSINYFLDNRNQFRFSWKHSNDNILSTANTTLTSSTELLEKEKSDERQSGINLLYNRLLSKDAAFSVSVQYKYGLLSGNYTLSPAFFNEFFNFSGLNDNLMQTEQQKLKTLFIQAKYIKKLNRHSLSLSIYRKYINESTNNSIAASSLQEAKLVGEDSINNSQIKWITTGAIMQDRWSIGNRITLGLSTEIQHYTGGLNRADNNIETQKKSGFQILPGADVGFKISKESKLNISFNYGTKFSGLSNAGYGYTIHDITSVYKNADTIQMQLTRSLNLFYSYASLLDKKMFLFSNLSFISTPLLNLYKIQPYQSVAFNEMLPTSRKTQAVNLLISGIKFYHGYRTQVSPTINLSNGYTYTIIQNREEKISFNQTQLGVAYNTEIKKVQLKTSVQYTIKSQQYIKTTTNKNIVAMFNINWKMRKRVFADIGLKYNYLMPYKQAKVDFLSASAKLQCQSANEKWDYGLLATNIFNQSSYSVSNLSENVFMNTFYKLFPRMMMAFVKYRF